MRNAEAREKVLLAGLSRDSHDALLLSCLASAWLFGLGRRAEALRWIDKARLVNPSHPLVRWDYALVLAYCGDNADACAMLDDLAASLVPDSVWRPLVVNTDEARAFQSDCVAKIGHIHMDISDYRTALDYFDKAVNMRAEGELETWCFYSSNHIYPRRREAVQHINA